MNLLVLVVLLGMWGFVLYPLLRQRNARVDEIRSVARFSSALRVLSSPSLRAGDRPGMRQLHMPPRAGLAAVAAARTARLTTARGPGGRGSASGGVAAKRRRQVMAVVTGFWVLSLLLVVVAGTWTIQLLADVSLAGGVFLCRWSVAQEQAAAARARRRHSRSDVAVFADAYAYADGHEQTAAAPVMTVPLDAPALPRRAAPTVSTPVAAALEPVARPAAATRRGLPARPVIPAARHEAPVQEFSDVRVFRPSPSAPPAPVTPAPRSEPVVLAEIDIDWEPAVAEPASGVRLVNLNARTTRSASPIFDDAAVPLDVGDDEGLDRLVAKRAAASGW